MKSNLHPSPYCVWKTEIQTLRTLRIICAAINQLAGVLADLNLVRPLTASELKRFARDETRTSYGNLAALREQHAKARTNFERKALPWKMWVRQAGVGESDDRLRNHGLLSKAQRALDIAGWSVAAQCDVEVFRLVDCDGLTPLLALFNAATLAKGIESIEATRREQELLEERRRLQIADHRGD